VERPLNPRFVGVGGPIEGGIFAIEDEELFIGRDRSCGLVIADASVSRRHCVLHKAAPNQIEIRDLGSRNGTVVNGLPISVHILNDRDEIRLGECHFLFLLYDSTEEAGSVPLHYAHGEMDSSTFHQLRPEDSRLNLERLHGGREHGRLSESLRVLMRIGAVIQEATEAMEFAGLVLDCVFEAIPAHHGALLLFEGASDDASFVCWRERNGNAERVFRAHSEAVVQSRRDGTAILGRGGESNPDTRVLVAPVMGHGRVIGVLYLETDASGSGFDQDHLELATAIGGITGMPLESLRRVEWLVAENQRLKETSGVQEGMVGVSPRIHEVAQFIKKVAPTDATVLIRGESGTGKEVVARAVHRNSRRAQQAFVAINCAALTETLLESELFGHEKGAFTGAVARKKGKIEVADHGTLFLDEVGELPLTFQTKLLRVLQEREFERVGGTQPIQVDVRLIAATNRDLEAAITEGIFRRDLFYRLNVLSIMMPALRERREDIGPLARYFVVKHGKRANRRVAGLSREALACLEAYDWPGNVRELENAIEHAVVLGSTELIVPEDLPEAVMETEAESGGLTGKYHEEVRDGKKRAILAALERSGGNFTEAAKVLGVHPNYLHRLVRNLNLRSEIKK
jgi:transcriptional regulator with GAF, ATPase, and Fis domain